MLNTRTSIAAPLTYEYFPANWEEDIQDVVVEACDSEEDPLGYRVIFYRECEKADQGDDCNYSMGASYLKNRLKKLSRAGFQAPMTEKAINLVEKKRFQLAS